VKNGGSYNLDVEIIVNFESIIREILQRYFNMMTKYYGRTLLGDNLFSKCVLDLK
jgi:hypothetical protein